jgi:hypothetical protein
LLFSSEKDNAMRKLSRFLAAFLICSSQLVSNAQCREKDVGLNDWAGAGGIFGAGTASGEMTGAYITVYQTGRSINPVCAGGLRLELGYAHNLVKVSDDGAFGITYDHTLNFTKSFDTSQKNRFHPFFNIGYTRFFLGGNAVHYGGGILWKYGGTDNGFRLEYRGYSLPGQGPVSTIRLSHEWGSSAI